MMIIYGGVSEKAVVDYLQVFTWKTQ